MKYIKRYETYNVVGDYWIIKLEFLPEIFHIIKTETSDEIEEDLLKDFKKQTINRLRKIGVKTKEDETIFSDDKIILLHKRDFLTHTMNWEYRYYNKKDKK